jgi:hypothetical protein
VAGREDVAAVALVSSGWIDTDGYRYFVIVHRLGRVRPLDLDLHVEAARPQDRGVVRSSRFEPRSSFEVSTPSGTGAGLRHDRRLDVGDARAADAEDRVIVEEHDHGQALFPAPSRG